MFEYDKLCCFNIIRKMDSICEFMVKEVLKCWSSCWYECCIMAEEKCLMFHWNVSLTETDGRENMIAVGRGDKSGHMLSE